MEETIHCNTCNLDYKNDHCYKKHLNTSRHIERSTNANIVIFTCICKKSYSYHQSLRLHQKTCQLYQTSDKESAPSNNNKIISSQVQQLRIENNDLREKQKACEKDVAELKVQIASLLNNKNIQTPVHQEQDSDIKSRDKRKKINKDTRKLIADSQQNTCGECKLPLSPYYQIDHIVGLQFGGTNEESNLMALCCECHCIKSIKENQRRKAIKEAIQNILRMDI